MKQKTFIQILGTAQDGGYPQVGCNCPNCKAAKDNPKLIRLPSCLGVIDTISNKSFIIDATPALPNQLERLNNMANKLSLPKDHLKGILLTHAHLGHYTGLMYLGKEALNTNNLSVYCTKDMCDFLSNNAPWSDLIENGNIKLVKLDLENEFKLTESLNIRAVSVPHRNEHADTVGFIIKGKEKSAFYLPDFDYWNDFTDQFNKITKEIDYMFLDGTFFDENELMQLRSRNFSEVPHPHIKKSITLFKEGILKKNKSKIYFTHFNHTNRVLSSDNKYKAFVYSSDFNILDEEDCFDI